MRDTKGDFIRAAFISSLIGGAALAFTMVVPAAGGAPRQWLGSQIAAYPFIGHQVYEPGFRMWPMMLGTLIHFAIAFVWALAFVFAVRKRTRVQTMLLSIPFAAVVWLVMHQIVLRVVAGDLLSRFNPLVGFAQHLVFAVGVSATLVLLQPQNWRFGRTRRALAA